MPWFLSHVSMQCIQSAIIVLPICPSVRPSVRLSVCLFVCLSTASTVSKRMDTIHIITLFDILVEASF